MNDMKIAIKQTDDIAWIIEASVDLSEATDADLQAIKAKKWYNKLLDTITFSKDDQIQIAKDIGSLAKLQEIIIRVLVMLSQENVAISTAVRQQAELIKGLSAKDTALLSALKKIKYGGTTQIDFSDLDRGKKVLIASLLIMADPTIQRNDYSKRYIGSILQIANVTALDNTVNPAAVDDLNREEQELLYRMIMVDRYLKDMDFEEPSEIVDWISVNPKRKKEIRVSIIETACAVTPDFFVTYYEKNTSTYDEINANDIQFEDLDFSGNVSQVDDAVEGVSPLEYEEIVLSSILHVSKGETLTYRNKNIHIQTIIECEGNLEFRNCTIHYGETQQFSEIKVVGNGSLTMEQCKIENHSNTEKFFIDIGSDCKATEFIDCQFVNCNYFLFVGNTFLLQKCQIINYGGKFIESSSWGNTGTGTVKDSVFFDINIPEFIIQSRKKENCISCRNFFFDDSTVTGCLKLNTVDDAAAESCFYRCFIESSNVSMTKSSFTGLDNVLACGGTIQESSFVECKQIIKTSSVSVSIKVKDSVFEKCTDIGHALSKGSQLLHCKFINCFNQLVSSHYDGGIKIDYCEFSDCIVAQEQIHDFFRKQPSLYYHRHNNAMLSFRRTKGKDAFASAITNCTFNRINTHHFLMVIGTVHERVDGFVVTVANCSFTNCSTERLDGKIIKEYDHYFGLFNKEVEVKTVSISSNCRGLDKVLKV